MTDHLGNPPAPPVRRRRLWRFVAALPALVVLIGIGAYVYLAVSADSELRAVIARTDQSDPRWRLEDVEADRAAVPDAENSATTVIAVKQLLPEKWPFWDGLGAPEDPPDAGPKRQALQKSFLDLEPQRQLSDEQTTALRTEMTRAAGALAEARKLADQPEGRYAIAYSADWIGTLMPHVQDAREVASLLSNDALLRAQDKDPDGALASCRGVLNAGRSIGDEPNPIAQLVRIACRAIATRQAERALAQGEPSEDALRRFQELLEKEGSAPLLLIAIRGERAGMDRLMEGIQSGKVKISPRDLDMTARFGGQSAPSLGNDLTLWAPGSYKFQRAAMLRYMDRCVELAELPPEQRHVPFQQLEATTKDQPVLVRLLVPALSKVSDASQRSQAQLRCAVVAVAAERYRRAKGRWPDTLEELKRADYLPGVPTDPYDGQPLRWRRWDAGVEVYSIGPDGADDGGKMDRQNPTTPGTDIGFRLWDVPRRRQPPDAGGQAK